MRARRAIGSRTAAAARGQRLHAEFEGDGNAFRAQMLDEVHALLRREQRNAERRRQRFFRPDLSSVAGYEASAAEYRKQLAGMLGWPLAGAESAGVPAVSSRAVGRDALGRISRLWIETLPGVRTYGLLFQPHRKGRLPLVIAQHGGLGTPEVCSGFFGSENYNDMTRRVLRRGVAVFAPQLMLWNPKRFGPEHRNDLVDRRLKQVGGSLAALELFRISRCLDALLDRRDVDPERVGMIGLSYGGFYTLFAAALDVRIRAAVSSCFVNDRTRYDHADWSWFGAANRFLDAEVGALVCPRALCVEVGRRDELFDVRGARAEARKIAAVYRRLGLSRQYRYREHPGSHELDRDPGGIDFLCRHLGVD